MRTSSIYILVVIFGLAPGGCSSRSTNDDAGAIWPDAFLDASQDLRRDAPVDQAPPAPDRGRDQPAADLSRDVGGPTWNAASTPAKVVDLNDVECVKGHVFIAGDKGLMLHRSPGAAAGAGFTSQAVNTQATLYTVAFSDLTYGVAAGKDPLIWETKDAGKTWTIAAQCSSYVFATFFAMHFSSPTEAFGVGYAVNSAGAGYKYYGGYSWVCGSPTYPNQVFHDVFRDGKKGWIVGSTGAKIYTSTDDGYNWSAAAAGTSEILRGIDFPDAKTGVAVGHKGAIVRSVDGAGLTWKAVTSPVAADLKDVFFWDSTRGWAAGSAGTILHTGDGGKTWSAQPSGTTEGLEAICFTSATDGWAVGSQGTVLYTTTGGS